MENHEDRFVVFLRDDNGAMNPQSAERELLRCPTLEEAKSVRLVLKNLSQTCIIRYEGASGGGD